MILDKKYERSAIAFQDTWKVSDKCSYRWLYPDKKPASDWFPDIDAALVWIKRNTNDH